MMHNGLKADTIEVRERQLYVKKTFYKFLKLSLFFGIPSNF